MYALVSSALSSTRVSLWSIIAPGQTLTHTLHESEGCLLGLKLPLRHGCVSTTRGTTWLWLGSWVPWFAFFVLF